MYANTYIHILIYYIGSDIERARERERGRERERDTLDRDQRILQQLFSIVAAEARLPHVSQQGVLSRRMEPKRLSLASVCFSEQPVHKGGFGNPGAGDLWRPPLPQFC